MLKKVYDVSLELNTVTLVAAAICTVMTNGWGPVLFVYASVIGLLDAIGNESGKGAITNSTFLALNGYYLVVQIVERVG